MQSSQSWRTRHDELQASLRRIGALLGDQTLPSEQRERIAAEFVTTWQEFTLHIKQNPEVTSTAQPRP